MEYRRKELTDPGAMRTWIQVIRRSIEKDKDGYENVLREPVLRTRVRWVNARGAYENRFASTQNTDTAKRVVEVATVTMRYTDKVSITDEIEKDGKTYEIIAINNINDRKRYLKLDLQRLERGE